jgi:uncharacterized protein (TIGR02611 family)
VPRSQHSTTRLARKIVVTIAGVAVLGLGVAMLALPGPGVLVIALGFLILSSEYEWARRRFETARRKGAELAQQAVSNPWSTAASLTGGLLIIAAGIVWGSVSSLPFSSWWAGGSLIVGGLICLATIFYSLYQGKHQAPRPSDRRREPSRDREVTRV